MPYRGRLIKTLFQQMPILGHLRCYLGCKFSSCLTPGYIRNCCNYLCDSQADFQCHFLHRCSVLSCGCMYAGNCLVGRLIGRVAALAKGAFISILLN
jgi:hypothetical protein